MAVPREREETQKQKKKETSYLGNEKRQNGTWGRQNRQNRQKNVTIVFLYHCTTYCTYDIALLCYYTITLLILKYIIL